MEKLATESKKELIGKTLRAEIRAGKFSGHFPSERALVRRFAAARETVRAALRDLEDDNLIRRCVGSGTTVTSSAAWRRAFAILLGNGYNTNPFYMAMKSGVERTLAKHGSILISASSFAYRESDRMACSMEFVRMCIRERLSGVFYQPLHFLRNGERANRAVLSALHDAGIPVVLMDSDFVQPPQRSAYDLVGTDNLRIGYDLARHMIEAGAKRIAYVTRPKPAPTSMLRGMGVGFAVSEAGLRWRKEDMMFVRYSDAETSVKHPDADVRATAKRIAADRKRPDALIVGDDYLGVVLMESLREEGLKVPDDILVAGVNGDPVSGRSDPPLTTFVQPCEEIGVAAVELMLSRINNPSLPPREVMIASRFVARASTAHSRKRKQTDMKPGNIDCRKWSRLLPMRKVAAMVAAVCTALGLSAAAPRTGPWTKAQAWAWYDAQPWMRGCNYLPASAANYTDMWQALGSEERFEEMERELSLAEATGFNVMRLIICEQGFGVWLADHDGFMSRFGRWLEMLDRHGMRAIVLLGNDCSRPKEYWSLPRPGPQPNDWGYHGGRKVSQHGSLPDAVGYTVMDDPKLGPKFCEMCREIVAKHRDDPRIAFWNVWNEPGNNNRGALTLSHMRRLFEMLWAVDPVQPLAADVWTDGYGTGLSPGRRTDARRDEREAAQKLAGELSDIVSYHCYGPYEEQVKLIRRLRRFYGRPLVNTEWLARCLGCNVAECYPLFYIEKIGAVNFGFVAGRYQMYEPWEGMWKEVERGGGRQYDMTKWFHDLYRSSHRPYDPNEIELIKRFNSLADEDFQLQHKPTKEKE